MSQVHKVIILNKPLKIFDFTPIQLIMHVIAIITALLMATNMPKEWKFNNVPAGVFVFVAIVGASIVLGKMSEVKPWSWWKNMVLYRLGLVPNLFVPKPEPAPLYPDPNIIDSKKKTEQYYVEAQDQAAPR
ncbi:MAG TPA: hypothetical protein V6C89_12110 [Drouetiella sp.]|jgi:hypothetical protein